VAWRRTTAPCAASPLIRADVVPGKGAEGCVKGCGWHGMQGVRGSNPLSSTTYSRRSVARSAVVACPLTVGCPTTGSRLEQQTTLRIQRAGHLVATATGGDNLIWACALPRGARADMGSGQDAPPRLARLGLSAAEVVAAVRLDSLMTATQARSS
jgi:hypothetical protein